jgi:Grx4 family monothiol glutaredoxin
MVEAIQEALAAAQRAMSTGDAPGARGHYEKALGLADTEERKGEIHLSLAEMTWQAGDKAVALEHYASARRIAKETGDIAREGMISLGLGFALLNSGDDSDLGAALEAMRRSKELAEAQGHAPQVNFVASLIAQAERRKDLAQRSEEEEQAAMLEAFVSSLVCRSPIMLFMKGTALKPACGFSKEAARKLMDLEIDFDTVDISQDSKLRDAVKKFSNWPTFPQLFVEGELFGGADIIEEMIGERVLLEEIGAKLKELPPAVDAEAGKAAQEGDAGVVEVIEGTCVPRKVWPEPVDELSSCGHGHGHGSSGECEKWTLDIKPPKEGERWQVTLDPHDPSTCTEDHHGGDGGSCSHHGHGHGGGGGGGGCAEHGHGHGLGHGSSSGVEEYTGEEPQLSEEAKQWMRDHPVRHTTQPKPNPNGTAPSRSLLYARIRRPLCRRCCLLRGCSLAGLLACWLTC